MIEKHIHHTFWCFNENSGDTGGLLTNDFQDWDMDKYEFVEPSLWQNEDGKYISLDHKIPLGQSGNGISLSDYYSGSPKPPVTQDPEYGDANCDGDIKLSDAILVLQAIGNPEKYGVNGSDESHITKQGIINGDVSGGGDGLTSTDALVIQKYTLYLISSLPEKA